MNIIISTIILSILTFLSYWGFGKVGIDDEDSKILLASFFYLSIPLFLGLTLFNIIKDKK